MLGFHRSSYSISPSAPLDPLLDLVRGLKDYYFKEKSKELDKGWTDFLRESSKKGGAPLFKYMYV